jgi:adenylosuccinate lyase
MAIEVTKVLKGLEVRPQRMLRNLQFAGGVAFSGRVLTALVDAGMPREDAYAIVQTASMQSLEEGGPGFRSVIEKDADVKARIGEQFDQVFDPWVGLEHTDLAFERLGLGVKTS